MTIDEIKKDLFINSEEVCENTMVDLYEAQDCCDNSYRIGYNKAIDDFKEELFKNSERARPVGWLGHSEIVTCEKIYEIAEELKVSEAE